MPRPIVVCGTPEFAIESRALAIAGIANTVKAAAEKAARAVIWYGEFAAAFGLDKTHGANAPDAGLWKAKRTELMASLTAFAKSGEWNGQIWYVGHSCGGGSTALIGGYSASEFTTLAKRTKRPAGETRKTYLASSSINFGRTVSGSEFATFVRECIPLAKAPTGTTVSLVMLACWIGDNKAGHGCTFLRQLVPMLNDPTVPGTPPVVVHATKFETWYGGGSTASVNGVRAGGFNGAVDTWTMFKNLKEQERTGKLKKSAFNVHLHQDYLEATVKPSGAAANWAPPPKVMFSSLENVLTCDYESVSVKPQNSGKRKFVFTSYFWSAGYGAVCRDKSNKVARIKASGKPSAVEVGKVSGGSVTWEDQPYLA